MLKFSKANAKTQALKNDSELADYLTDKRKIYSLDLLSGYSCPYAEKCLSKAVEFSPMVNVKLKMVKKQSSVVSRHLKRFSIPTYTIHASTILTLLRN